MELALKLKSKRRSKSRKYALAKDGSYIVALFILISMLEVSASTVQPATNSNNNVNVNFDQYFYVTWGNPVLYNHTTVELRMDRNSGSGFASKEEYVFGYFSSQIKLMPADSAGTVTAFYLSTQDVFGHDELDMEFLGNGRGNPPDLQTNVFVNGTGGRESRIKLWFDPRKDFHTYSILWNKHYVLFLVDEMPIRVFKNSEKTVGVAYPSRKPMRIMASLWNGEKWATEGGKARINWNVAPFLVTFKDPFIEAHCGANHSYSCPPSSSWWEDLGNKGLTPRQARQLRWVRRNYMTYDYCTDYTRFHKIPPECALNTS